MLLAPHISQNAPAMIRGEVIRDHGPAIMGHEVEAVESKDIEQGQQLLGDPLLPVIAGTLVGLPVALEVRSYDAMSRSEGSHLAVPHEPRLRQPVQKHHWL